MIGRIYDDDDGNIYAPGSMASCLIDSVISGNLLWMYETITSLSINCSNYNLYMSASRKEYHVKCIYIINHTFASWFSKKDPLMLWYLSSSATRFRTELQGNNRSFINNNLERVETSDLFLSISSRYKRYGWRFAHNQSENTLEIRIESKKWLKKPLTSLMLFHFIVIIWARGKETDIDSVINMLLEHSY